MERFPSTGKFNRAKNYRSPERSEWAAARHGEGRKPGDGKLTQYIKARASATLSLRSGFGLYFVYYPAFRR